MSSSSATGSSSLMACAISDFPVPGNPISSTFLFCTAAFFAMLTARSCPIICSWIFSETGISLVFLKDSRVTFVFVVCGF